MMLHYIGGKGKVYFKEDSMGTGYSNKVKFEITGDIEEGVGTNYTEILKKELELVCAKHGVDLYEVDPYLED